MAILKGLKYELMLKLLDISEIKDSTLSASNSKIVIWKTKHFFSTFIAFLECTLNLEKSEINEPHSSGISEVIDSERRACLNA